MVNNQHVAGGSWNLTYNHPFARLQITNCCIAKHKKQESGEKRLSSGEHLAKQIRANI